MTTYEINRQSSLVRVRGAVVQYWLQLFEVKLT